MAVKKKKRSMRSEFVDVVDASDRPLAIMRLKDAHRQSLRHRSALVLVYNRQGALYLQKRSMAKTLFPGRYDVSAGGHVGAGEARLDAAERELRGELGIKAPRLSLVRSIPASRETGWEFVSLYSAGRIDVEPEPNPDEVSEGVFVDHDELAFMVDRFRELLTPAVVQLFSRRLLFS